MSIEYVYVQRKQDDYGVGSLSLDAVGYHTVGYGRQERRGEEKTGGTVTYTLQVTIWSLLCRVLYRFRLGLTRFSGRTRGPEDELTSTDFLPRDQKLPVYSNFFNAA